MPSINNIIAPSSQ